MNSPSHSHNDSKTIVVVALILAVVGFFAYRYFHNSALENAAKVVPSHSSEPLPSVPASVTLPATSIKATSAVFNGKVTATEPLNAATASFMYGTMLDYGQTVQGTISKDGMITATVTGLKCKTLYYYRTVAVNPNGRTLGAAQKFTTLACAAGKTTR